MILVDLSMVTRSVSWSVNRSNGLTAFQAYVRSVTRSIEQSVVFPVGHSFVWSVGWSVGRPVDWSVGWFICTNLNQSFDGGQPAVLILSLSVDRSIGRSVDRSVGRSVSEYGDYYTLGGRRSRCCV